MRLSDDGNTFVLSYRSKISKGTVGLVVSMCRDGRLSLDNVGIKASLDLSRRSLCPVGPGQKSAERAGSGQKFAGLSRPLPIPDDSYVIDQFIFDEKNYESAVLTRVL